MAFVPDVPDTVDMLAHVSLIEIKRSKEKEAVFAPKDSSVEDSSVVPHLKNYSKTEIFEKIILPLIDKYPEILWFADPKVAITQEGIGALETPGWTHLLREKGSLKHELVFNTKESGKYIELERMLGSVVFFHLLYCIETQDLKEDSEKEQRLKIAHQQFVSSQKKEEQLSEDSFKELHQLAKSVAKNNELYNAVVLMLVISDLGKTPKATESAKGRVKSGDHDDFMENLLSLDNKTISEIIPSFKNVSAETQAFIIDVAKAMKIHLGHVLHLEGGLGMFHKFEKAVHSGKITEDVFDFAFLIQMCDVAASQAHINCDGAKALDEFAYQGYKLVGQALRIIQKGGNGQQALDFLLEKRGELVGIRSDSPINRVLIRLGCLMRFYTKNEGAMLAQAANKLSQEEMKLLIEQFGMEKVPTGINHWKRNPTYLPTVLINLFQMDNIPGKSMESKMENLLKGAVSAARILEKYGEIKENRESDFPLNLNSLAGAVKSNPLCLINFDLKYFNVVNSSVVFDAKAFQEDQSMQSGSDSKAFKAI